jgi:DNA-binding transcriptional LysR family regulator
MTVLYEDLPSLALFAEVVRARSFSEAARRTGVAKSAVSKRIAQLEERLGVRLLVRSTRKLALTSEGAAVYEHCAALVEAADRAVAIASGASELPRGTVRINAPVTFAQMQLAPALAAFLREHGEIDLVLSADDRLVDVADGAFDLVIRITRLASTPALGSRTQPSASTSGALVTRRLASTRLVVCASPDYLAQHGVPETPAELVHHHCLHYSLVPFASEWRFRGPDGPYVVPARSPFASSDGTVLRQLARAGAGLVVLPWFMVAGDVERGALSLVLDGQRRAQVGIYALFAHRKQLPLRTRLLVNFLAKYFAREGWELRV